MEVMKNKKIKKILKIYGFLGKSLCACAGGIIGFILGGPLLAFSGIFLGNIGGELLEKSMGKI
jgi:hypothetical protein